LLVRRPVALLVVAVIAVLSFGWWKATRTRRSPQPSATAPFDWGTVSSRDLNIAGIFLTARDVGIARAMDSLERLANRDSAFWNDGHMIAHGLGRFAIANNGHDPSVLSQCRPTFQAGCYHGVLEGYLASMTQVDAPAMTHLCTALQKPRASPYEALECAHGLGHGFLEALRYDLTAALRACDAFSASDLRVECHDGVFMENAVHGLGMPTMNVGDSATRERMHAMSHAAPTLGVFRASDPRFPCDSVATQYQPSCWMYQPLVIARLVSYNYPKILAGCETAPAASLAICYGGIGKQSMGWFNWDFKRVISMCGTAGAHEADCLAGGVDLLIDFTVTADRALAFCRATPEGLRGSCFARVGARMSRIRSEQAEIALDCSHAADRAYVDACIRGSRQP
jgi:hypothetical protein